MYDATMTIDDVKKLLFSDEMKAQMRSVVSEEIEARTRSIVREEIESQTRTIVREEIEAQTRAIVREEIEVQVDELRSESNIKFLRVESAIKDLSNDIKDLKISVNRLEKGQIEIIQTLKSHDSLFTESLPQLKETSKIAKDTQENFRRYTISEESQDEATLAREEEVEKRLQRIENKLGLPHMI